MNTARDDDALFARYVELQRYVDWTQDDAARVRGLLPVVEPAFDALVDDFYVEIERHEETAAVIGADQDIIRRLKTALRSWIVRLFSGVYDHDYVRHRWNVGLRHVEVGLSQVFAAAALARLRNGVVRVIFGGQMDRSRDLLAAVESLNKLLDLDLAVIQDAYETESRRRQQQFERKRGEAAFRSLVEAAGCMIVILREDGAIAYFSPYAERLSGYAADEVSGKNFALVFMSDSDGAAALQITQRAIAAPEATDLQFEIVTRSGARRTMLWNTRRLDGFEEQPVLLAVGHDVTSLHEARQKAVQAERLAAIGQMAAGMAHEGRNALQRIRACAESLEVDLESNADALEMLRRVQSAERNLHRLFEEIRGYAAPIHLQRNAADIVKIWREAWSLLAERRKDEAVRFAEHVETADTSCRADRFRLIQVFRNVLENALSAGGDLPAIDVGCRDTQHQGRPALLAWVRDNGAGLDEQQRTRIFEPFYTTKATGMGLGMAITQRIVDAHGGIIRAVSDIPAGAEIQIVLPRG